MEVIVCIFSFKTFHLVFVSVVLNELEAFLYFSNRSICVKFEVLQNYVQKWCLIFCVSICACVTVYTWLNTYEMYSSLNFLLIKILTLNIF